MAAVRLLRLKGQTDPNVDPVTGMWMSGTYRKPVVQNPAPVLPGQNLPPEVTSIPGAKPKPTKYGAREGVNAKTLPFDQPGAGNAGYGVDVTNVYTVIDKLRAHKGEKAGGSKQLWDNLSRWTSTPQVAHLNTDQQRLFDQFIQTGKRDPALKDRTVLLAVDWALRDVARGQQHKQGFLDSFLGKLVTVALEVGATVVTGNPAAGAAVGAAIGGVKGGLKGAIFGGIEGYGVGSATNWVANGGLTALTQPVGGGINASGATVVDKAVNVAGNLVVKGQTALSGGLTVGGALSAVNAGASIKGWMQGGATAAAIASILNQPTVPKPNLGDKVSPPPVTVTPEERQAEMVRRRRAAVQTDLTWGNALTAPLELSKPTLLGAPLRLAA